MIFAIIGGMVALDGVWWLLSFRLVRRRPWRLVSSLFISAQLLGLLVIIASRSAHLGHVGYGERVLPKFATAAIYIWHFIGLGIVLLMVIGALPFLLFQQIRRFLPAWPQPVQVDLLDHCGPEASGLEGTGVSRREFLGIAAAVTPPLFTLSLTGLGLAQLKDFRIRRFELPLEGLPRQLDGMTIAQVSDIHIGRFTSGRILDRIATATNELRADLVLLTGDLIDDALADLPEGIALVRKLQAQFGLCMIEGNHDLIENGAEFERRVRASGVPFLLNETTGLEVRGYPVQLLGVRWDHDRTRGSASQIAESVKGVAAQRQADAFPILLAHHPHAFDAAVEAGLPLTLSGHTHGGQIMLNEQVGFGPAMFRYWSGLYTQGNSRMIVSNGVGNWFPVRVNAPAEIVHLTLRRV
jgi:predicted MPP superfamily phosphohydrolase